jgi:cardiolipin synthase C
LELANQIMLHDAAVRGRSPTKGVEMIRHETEATANSTIVTSSGLRAGVSLMPDNLTAFALRVLSARAATRTLDLQYYRWAEDITGRLLANEVLRAAERGVRVRLLLDDLYVRESEPVLATLSQHPGIDIRLFNPFQLRSWGALGSAIEFLFAGYRLNHRMHNKAWIADGELFIGGGRNIGDAYFDASSQFNFRDLDLAVTGPAVSHAITIFERYWTDRRVRPIERVAVSRPRPNGQELRQALATTAESASSAAYLERVRALPELTELLQEKHIPLAADKIRIIADPPGKRLGRRRPPGVLGAIRKTLGSAQKRVILVSPYFVPGRRGSRLLISLLRRGVAVSILTNSLAATDVLAVHGGYARYRRRLLKAGVELYELKRGGQEGKSMFGSGGASLHTKAFVMDDAVTFVGSFNLDPRSANLNTEMGAFVEDLTLADQFREEHRRLTDPERSWLVALEGHRLTWRGHVAGHMRMLHIEPGTTLLRRLLARMFGWLPIEPQL